MSVPDQQHTLKLVAALLSKKGASKIFGILVAIPLTVGSLLAIAAYNYTANNYVRELNFAKNNVPILIDGLIATRDTLRNHGYHFPELTLVK